MINIKKNVIGNCVLELSFLTIHKMCINNCLISL